MLALSRNLFVAARCRRVGCAHSVARQVLCTCCFLHGPMCRNFGVGIRSGLEAVEDQRVHHSGHLTKTVGRWSAAASTETNENLNISC